jgi:hypothetical protein
MPSTRKRTSRRNSIKNRRTTKQRGGTMIKNITFVFLTGKHMTLSDIEDTETVYTLKETVRFMGKLASEARIRLIVEKFELRDDFRTLGEYRLAERLERPGTLIQVHVSYPRRPPVSNLPGQED